MCSSSRPVFTCWCFLWGCRTARPDRTLFRFCSMSKMFFCTLSAFVCSFSIRALSSVDWPLGSKHTATGKAAVCFVHKPSLFPSVKAPLQSNKTFSYVLWVLKLIRRPRHIWRVTSQGPKPNGYWISGSDTKINICKEKTSSDIYCNYRIFLIHAFIINDRQKKLS